ncbi:MAG: DinB family protein [Candidatus Acidiferrum sp.]
MTSLQPQQALFLFQTILPSLKSEHATTKKIIDAIPLDKGDYRPDPISKSALELAWHIAAAQHRFLDGVAAGQFDYDRPSRPESARNSADISAWYENSFAANIERLAQLSPEQLSQVIDFRGRLQWPAVMFLQLCLSHEIHHRGQLSTYLRPMGAKVPSIYGESYDATQARLAAVKT